MPRLFSLYADLNAFSQMLRKITVETAMNAELDAHLGYEKYQSSDSDNYRNGTSSKTLITEDGEIEVGLPRDRDGSFEPQLVKKHQLQTSFRLSGLPSGYTLANFDFSFQPSVERSRIETLATCQWIRENRILLIQEPPGVGKTHLAVALGAKAIEHGFGVVFYRLEELLAMMRRDADLSPQHLRRKKYVNTSLLIVDEISFEPMTRQEASLFFRLVSHRYEKGAVIITTNKGIEAWPEVLAGDEILATAILDRLLHRSHVLNIKGRSYRLRELETALAAVQ